jgi:hypothetical protein
MRFLLVPLAACAALTGCVGYGDAYSTAYPSYGYGTSVGGYYPYGSVYSAPVYPATVGNSPYYYPGSAQRGMRDRDRDGIPNRVDNDRDGDGVPNQLDRRPNNPRRQ